MAFRGDFGDIISNATYSDFDSEGLILAEASKIIRRDILQMNTTQFDGNFYKKCQEQSAAQSLRYLLSHIMHGNQQENLHHQQATFTIAQLLRFNTLIRTRESSTSMYHSRDREPPIAIYLGELIHSKTRNLKIVDKLAHLGLCISKERLSQISTNVGNIAIETFERDGVVVPLSLELGLFCTTAVDNIDVNPTSSTATGSLHGTAASINQHAVIDRGIKRTPVTQRTDYRRLKKLPGD